jgi:cytochrome P450
MRDRVGEIANELLDAVDGQSSFDLMAAYCQPFPTIVIAEMLGVDPKDQADFKRWTDDRTTAWLPGSTLSPRKRRRRKRWKLARR